jgi:class 3 adenylate cyclase
MSAALDREAARPAAADPRPERPGSEAAKQAPATAAPGKRQGRWRPSIGTVMAVGFGGLVAIAIAAVLLVALGAAQRNTFDLLRTSSEAGLAALVGGLGDQLHAPGHAAAYIARAIESGAVAPDDEERLKDILLGALAATPQVRGIAFVRQDLRAAAAARDLDSVEFASTAESWVNRPDFRLAIRNGATQEGIQWADPAYLPVLGSTNVTLSFPVRRGEEYLGIVAAAVSIAGLSDILDRLPAAMGSTPFVLVGRERVLAHPALAGGLRGATAEKPLPALSEVGDPVLAAMWSKQVGALTAEEILEGSAVKSREVTAAGEEHLFLYREIHEFGPTPWLVGIHIPRSAAEPPIRRLVLAAIIGVGILLVAVFLALLLGRRIRRPIQQLAAVAEAIGRFDLPALRPLDRSNYRELDAAAGAFNAMLVALRWFETYVPRALVLLLMQRGGSAPLRPEEREITVMFTDIVGFTPISRRLRPLQLARFLTRHFTLIGRCIEAEGGTLDKYMGDSVMAFWNAPMAQDDHAARAARAALAICRTLRADNARRQRKGIAPVRLCVGVHTGPAVVGNTGAPGRINYTLIGDTVNICQRLEELGRTVKTEADVVVLISGATATRLGPGFNVVPMGSQELRGTGAVFEIHRLVESPAGEDAATPDAPSPLRAVTSGSQP